MVVIKVEHKENIRRFVLPSDANWIDLEAKLRSTFEIPALTPFTLSYTDEDNDVITLSTDIELREIFASNQTVKFNLKFSTSDDLSDSDSEVWVFEGNAKSTAPSTTIETDTSVLQSSVSPKNINSTTNQEPQYIEDDVDMDEASNKKAQVDDDFEKVENLSTDPKRVEKSPGDVERIENLPNDIEREGESPNDVDKEEELPNDVDREEDSPNYIDKVEELPNDVDKVEESPSGVENVEELPKDVDSVERSSNDLFVGKSNNISVEKFDRVENSSNKISRVNLLDDEFFESFNSPSFEPKPIPLSLSREVEDEQEDKETIETLSSSNSSAFSPFMELSQTKRLQDQNTDNLDQLKDMIEQYRDTIEKNPDLTASIMEQIRSSVSSSVDPERLDPFRRPIQSKEDKHNSYFRQHSITSPISGRSRSATPPRSDYNRSSTPEHNIGSSTPPRIRYNRSSTPEHRRTPSPPTRYNRSATPEHPYTPSPPSFRYNRPSTPEYTHRAPSPPRTRYNRTPTPESTPPQIPGAFPSTTPELWIEPDPNHNQKNARGRKGGRGRGRGRRFKNRSNSKQFPNDREETPDREETQDREETLDKEETLVPPKYRQDVDTLVEMFKLNEDECVKLLDKNQGNIGDVIDSLIN